MTPKLSMRRNWNIIIKPRPQYSRTLSLSGTATPSNESSRTKSRKQGPSLTRHPCDPQTEPPRRNTAQCAVTARSRGPWLSPRCRGTDEREWILTRASKEEIGAQGVDFDVTAAPAKGFQQIHLTQRASRNQHPRSAASTTIDRICQGKEQIGARGRSIFTWTAAGFRETLPH